MTKFKEGDRIKCVYDAAHHYLVEGAEYTVSQTDVEFIKIEGFPDWFVSARFELVEPAMKVGDMVEVSQFRKFPDGATFQRELLADLTKENLKTPFIVRNHENPLFVQHWKYARPIQEPKIELTVNGEPVEISAETLAAIKEAIQ